MSVAGVIFHHAKGTNGYGNLKNKYRDIDL